MLDEVSVRELRQNLSVYLRRVGEGQTLTVMSRGEPVALLAPLTGADPLAVLVAEGKVELPRAPGPLPEPLAPPSDRPALSDAVLALRDEDPR